MSRNPFRGNRGPLSSENDTEAGQEKHNITNQAQAATENSTTEYKPIDTAAVKKKKKRLKLTSKIRAENAVNFDLDEEEAKQGVTLHEKVASTPTSINLIKTLAMKLPSLR